MAALAPARTHECARCGKKQPTERQVFSHFTRNHYCADVDACARRAKKRSKT